MKTYNVFDKLDAGHILCKTLSKVGQDSDVEQVEEQLEAAGRALFFAALDELAVVKPLQGQWLADEVASSGLFFWWYVCHVVNN